MNVLFDPNAMGLKHLELSESTLTALLGYAVVFSGLLALMAIIYVVGAVFKLKAARRYAAVDTARAAHKGPRIPEIRVRPPAPAPELPAAPGTAGEVKLFDVPDKEAAMIMAIVADQMGKPLNELRFKSIKEVK